MFKMIDEIALAAVFSTVAAATWAQTPPAPPPITPTQMQIAEVKSRIATYERNLHNLESTMAAAKGLIAIDEATLATLEATAKPTGQAIAPKSSVPPIGINGDTGKPFGDKK